jgi:hypothetical protein
MGLRDGRGGQRSRERAGRTRPIAIVAAGVIKVQVMTPSLSVPPFRMDIR